MVVTSLSETFDPSRLRRAGVTRSVQVGELKVSYVPDGASKIVPQALLPSTTQDDWIKNADHLDESGWLTVSAGALLVERGDQALLIDAGYGPFSAAPAELDHPSLAQMYGGGLVENLRSLGRDPAEIHAVAFTHLHVEHVGWAGHVADGADEPIFSNARYLVSDLDWSERQAQHGVTQQMLDTMQRRVETTAAGDELMPGVVVLALPGHTPGHQGYLLSSGGAQMLVFGDAMHTSLQVAHPDWPLVAEPKIALRTRREVLDQLANQNVLGFGMHFADAQFGQVRREGSNRFRWEPVQ